MEKSDDDFLKLHQLYSSKVLKLKPGVRGVISNGRILAPLDAEEKFTVDDFNLLEKYSMNVYGDKIVQTLNKIEERNDITGENSFSGLIQQTLVVLLIHFLNCI